MTPEGRLTLTTGVAITTSDVAGVTTIYYEPCTGVIVPVFDGSSHVERTIGAGLALPLDANSGHTNYHQSAKNYDLFVIDDAGTLRLGSGPKWDTDTARGTGAGSTELECFDGQWVNKNTIAIRYGSGSGDTVSTPSRRATYVGSFRASANGQADDTAAARLLYNAFNQAPRKLWRAEPASSWTYSANAYRQVNANAANKIDLMIGLSGSCVDVEIWGRFSNSSATPQLGLVAVGLDTLTAPAAPEALRAIAYGTLTTFGCPVGIYRNNIPLGYHYLAMLEFGAGAETQTWTSLSSGISGWVWM